MKGSSKAPLVLLCKLSKPDPYSGSLAKGLLQRRHSEASWANLVFHFQRPAHCAGDGAVLPLRVAKQ